MNNHQEGEKRPSKAHKQTILIGQEINTTAIKRPDHEGNLNSRNSFFSQVTPKPHKKILLHGQNRARYLFPLFQDKEVGIQVKYQNVVIQSYNDDDRRTSSTQMQRGMIQTLEDLYDVLESGETQYYTQN